MSYRWAWDTIWTDGRMDGAILICLPKLHQGHKNILAEAWY